MPRELSERTRMKKAKIRGQFTYIQCMAESVGRDKKELRKRLMESKSLLTDEFRTIFGGIKFEPEKKRFISKDGKFALQWTTRRFPDKPVSSDNQQTSIGCVTVREL